MFNEYWNKQIDIWLGDGADAFEVRTPRLGRKPRIVISGSYTSTDQVNQLDVSISDFYPGRFIKEYTEASVSAGYYGQMRKFFTGSISTIYITSGGAGRTVEMSLIPAKMQRWYGGVDGMVNIHMRPGDSFKSAVLVITRALGMDEPEINNHLLTRDYMFYDPWVETSSGREALHRLRAMFPGVVVAVRNNHIVAYPFVNRSNGGGTGGHVYRLGVIKGTPLVTGSSITVESVWDPRILPGDIVQYESPYAQLAVGSSGMFKGQTPGKGTTLSVTDVKFQFGTYDENSMTINGIGSWYGMNAVSKAE